MQTLNHQHLLTLELEVDFKGTKIIGDTPYGFRSIVPVSSGRFSGERLNGTVLPGVDWVIKRSDTVMDIDVRLILETEEDMPFYLTCQGRFLAD